MKRLFLLLAFCLVGCNRTTVTPETPAPLGEVSYQLRAYSADGQQAFATELPGQARALFGPSQDGQVWVAVDGEALAFDASGQQVGEAKKLQGDPRAMMGSTVFSQSAAGVSAYDSDGKELWKQELGNPLWLTPSPEGLLVGTATECHLLGPDGKEIWKEKFEYQPAGASASGGRVFVTVSKPALFAYDLKTGKKLWEKSWDGGENNWVGSVSSPEAVFQSLSSGLVALKAETGEDLWTSTAETRMLAYQDGKVFGQVHHKKGVVVDAKTGETLAEFDLPLFVTIPLVAADGKFFVTGNVVPELPKE
ncbi:MAG: PQQ-binding-like beta-propeller repeat protein [Candidatus Eremiobacteraeota bacterium]|nr:PQQ-binding-like beta-propeller repeat protein [Candidatus Eremiobacteraeota bacterium]